MGSVVGSSWTFACCLRLMRSPIRPAITSNVPANMSQCGNCHSMPVTLSTYFFALQSLFFLEEEFLTTAEEAGLDHFAPLAAARKLFPGLDRPAAADLAQAAE
jgi:hypothetical protein